MELSQVLLLVSSGIQLTGIDVELGAIHTCQIGAAGVIYGLRLSKADLCTIPEYQYNHLVI